MAPGNPGMAPHVARGAADSPSGITRTDRPPEDVDADLLVIGPEQPLVDGLADKLRADRPPRVRPGRRRGPARGVQGLHEGGPGRGRACPRPATAPSTRPRPAQAFLRELPGPWVVKTDGLAAGKGVLVTDSLAEAEADIAAKLSGEAFGDAGRRVVVEEGLVGPECSLLVLCDGDPHRRAGRRPRTSSASATATTGPTPAAWGRTRPVPLVDDRLVDRVLDEAVEPLVGALRRRGIDYRGVLYAGLILTADGPRVLEYNVRFGDPETQVVLPRLTEDLTGLLAEAAAGPAAHRAPLLVRRRRCAWCWRPRATPAAPRTGDRIDGLEQAAAHPAGVTVFHAGTALDDEGRLVTAGGRVLGVTATGPTIAEARARAYAAVDAHRLGGYAVPHRHRRRRRPARRGAGRARTGARMIPRYSLPEMAALFTDEARFEMWLEVELLAVEGWAEVGVDPPRRPPPPCGPGPPR